jgi:hypothetical protein
MTESKPKNILTSSWHCPACKVGGTVRLSKNEGGMVYLARLIDLHKLSSPYCKGKQIEMGEPKK